MENAWRKLEINPLLAQGKDIKISVSMSDGFEAGSENDELVHLEPAKNKLEAEDIPSLQLIETPLPLDLTPDYLRLRPRSPKSEPAVMTLEAEAYAGLRRMSVEQGCSIFTAVFAAFTVLVH